MDNYDGSKINKNVKCVVKKHLAILLRFYLGNANMYGM